MSVCYIGLGSNLDSPGQQLARARHALAVLPATTLMATSALYRSAPLTLPGSAAQPDYFNAVIQLQTTLTPHDLLDALHAIERTQGRQRSESWAARTLDLDILLYDDLQLTDTRLCIPHPGIPQRTFVLYPLQDISPELEIPHMGKLSAMLAKLASDPSTGSCVRVGNFDAAGR